MVVKESNRINHTIRSILLPALLLYTFSTDPLVSYKLHKHRHLPVKLPMIYPKNGIVSALGRRSRLRNQALGETARHFADTWRARK